MLPRRRFAIALLLGAVLCATAPLPRLALADDSPLLEIRARTVLRLREGERGPRAGGYLLTVQARLGDGQKAGSATASDGDEAPRSFDGEPVEFTLVDLRRGTPVELLTQTVRTDREGLAVLQRGGLKEGRYRVLARYAGDALRDGASEFIEVDLGREPTTLELSAPTELGLNDRLAIRLHLRSPSELPPGPLTVTTQSVKRSVPLRSGAAELELKPKEALARTPVPGDVIHLQASFAGDALFSPALARAEVLLKSHAQISLELRPVEPGPERAAGEAIELPQGEKLLLFGQVSDETGPLRGESVVLEAGREGLRRTLGTAITDEAGRYSLTIPKLPLRPGSALISAQVFPHRHYVEGARSTEVALTVLPPEPVSPLYFLLPVVLTTLLGALVLLGRWLRPRLARLVTKLRSLRWRPEPEPLDSDPSLREATPAPTGTAGVTLSPRSPALVLRRTLDATVDGQVCDAVFGPALPGAEVSLIDLEPAASVTPKQVITCGDDGRFALRQIQPGRYVLCIRAPGYRSEELRVSIPHRGELRAIAVRLMPLRALLSLEWRRVAERLLGTQRVAAATPAELLDSLRKSAELADAQKRQDLKRLTLLVEEGYYSTRGCTTAMLDEAAELASRVLSSAPPPESQPAAQHGTVRPL